MTELSKDQIEKFVREVVKIERKFGFELKNSTTARQQEIGQYINKFVSEELADDHKED